MEILFHSILLLGLFIFSAFFSASETAIFSLSQIERRRLIERHPHLSYWVVYHLDHPRRILITILIGNLLVNTLSAAIAALIGMKLWGVHSLGFVMVMYTLILIIFSEIIPKVLAVQKNEWIAMLCSFPLHLLAILIYPIRILTRWVTDRILSFLIHEKKDHLDEISPDELKALVKIGEEEGVLDSQERHMIQKLFELGERPVKAIMTPRIDLIGLNIEDSMDKHTEVMKGSHFSHLPVYQGSLDHIIGVISAQDYVLNLPADIRSFMFMPFFVPVSKRIDDLLEEFRKKNQSYAICVDEYGGTAGIVTLEDILEEIFGEYYDEYAKVEQPIRSLGKREFIVEAKLPLSEFNEFFSTRLKSHEATTLGGFILEKLGEVPEKGKQLEVEGLEIRIHDVIRQRIRSVIVRRSHD